MGIPTGTVVLVDPHNTPIPQFWDPVFSGWVAYAGINTYSIGAYTFGAQALTGAGWFKGATGYCNSSLTVNGWIMAFDSVGAPITGTRPLYATPLAPVSGPDEGWFIAPAAPNSARYVASGIWIALSTTGGTFTASAVNAMTGTVEFYAAGT